MPSSLPTSKNAINVPSSPPSLSEAELLRVCLQRGREAAHLGQASLASHSYALITKLILKKCCNVEELIRFAVSMDASEPTVADDPQEVTHDTSPDNNASHEEIPPAAAMDINMMLLPPGLEDEDYEQERSYMCQSSSPVDQMGGSLQHSPNTMGISPKRNEGPEDIRRWIADICSRVDSDALPLSTIAAQCQVILTPNVGSEGTHFPSAHSLSSIGGGGEDGFGTNHPIANLPKVLSAGMHFHELSSSSNEDEEDDERIGALHGVPNEDPLANSNPGLRWDSGGAHQVAGPTRSLPPRLGRVKTADQRCFSLTVFLSALRWNVGFTLWEDGHLEEAHDWLMSADIARLREIVKADEERAQRVLEQSYHNDLAALTAYGAEGSQTMTEGTDHLYLKAVADVCTHKLDWQGLELTTSTGPHASRHRDTTDLSVSPSTILLPTNAPAGLPHDDLIANSKSTTPAAEYSWGNLLAVRKAKASRRLLERLITLRDVSALITSCHTPKDAAFVVQRMGKAMGDLSRCQGGVDRTSSHLKASVPQDELEGFAAMLLTLSVLTEYVLAKCAREEFRTRWKEHCQAQHHCSTSPVITSPSVCFKDNNMNHHGSSVSHSHAAHTLSPQDLKWVEDLEHASVRCACDDMVRQFTSGHYRSLHDLETQGLPPRDRVLTVLALGMHPTLAMNVLSTALNYVSLFRFSRVYRGVVIAEQVRDQREMTDAADLGPTNASTAPPSPTTPPPQGEDHSRSSSELSHGGSGGKRPASRLSSSLPSAVLSAARTGVNALRWGQQSIADYASEWLTPHAPPPPRLPADVIRSEDEMDSPNRHDDGRTLTLPSRRTVSLLPEEEVSELSGGSLTEEISLRLLTLIFRHHRPSLLAMEKIHVSTLYSVTNELNKAMQMLRTGMQLRFGLERFGQWSTEQEASTRAFYTQTLNELCEAAELQQRINDLSAQSHTSAPLPPASTHDTIERLKPVSSASYSVSATVVASPTATGSPSTLMASVTPPSVFPRADRSRSALSSFWSRPLYIPSDASMQQRRALSEGHPLKTEPSLEESASADHIGRADSTEAGAPPPCNANVSSVVASVIGAAASVSEGGPASPVVAWDMPVMFVPTVSIDFSAFTTTSLETQKATQEMIAQMQQQEAAASASRRRKDRAMNRQPAGGASSPTARYFGSPNASRSCGLDRRSGGPSVLFPECRQVLHNHLPLLQQYRNWRVIYNTSLHGISLQMMLLNCKREAEARQHLRDHQRNRPGDDYGCAMLLVMEMLPSLTLDFSMDSDGVRQARKAVTSGESTNRLFVGAYLNDLLRLETRRYYGNSDCFVFQLFIQGSVSLGAPPPPKLAVYRSSGANDQFVNCRSNSIVIGGGGSSSLYVAESLLRGSTSQCPTFNSPPLTTWASDDTGSGYSGSISFELLSLEVIVMD